MKKKEVQVDESSPEALELLGRYRHEMIVAGATQQEIEAERHKLKWYDVFDDRTHGVHIPGGRKTRQFRLSLQHSNWIPKLLPQWCKTRKEKMWTVNLTKTILNRIVRDHPLPSINWKPSNVEPPIQQRQLSSEKLWAEQERIKA
jgi:predicted RNA-binding protein (virulence factor B family)